MTASKSILRGSCLLLSWFSVWASVPGESRAAGGPAEEARRLLAEVAADASLGPLASRPSAQARALLERAAQSAPEQRVLLEEAALEWAEIARDSKRARDAEQAGDRLEQSLSALQTELVRTRASVEQAMARVGRARQELTELERSTAARSGSAGTAPAVRPPGAR